MSELKGFKKPAYLRRYVPALLRNEQTKSLIAQTPFPQSWEDLKKSKFLKYTSLPSELWWVAILVRFYSHEINSFIELERRFNAAFFYGDYYLAQSLLDEIKKQFGVSLWLLQSQLHLYQRSEGLAAQKEAASAIYENEHAPWFLRVSAYLMGLRAEDARTAVQLEATVAEMATSISATAANYLRYKVNELGNRSLDDWVHVFWGESNSSLIDRYLTFVDCAQEIFSSSAPRKLVENARTAISYLRESVVDERLETLMIAAGSGPILDRLPRKERYLECLDQYTAGNYPAVLSSFNEHECSYVDLDYLELMALSVLRSGKPIAYAKGSLAEQIFERLVQNLQRTREMALAQSALVALAEKYPFITAAKQLPPYIFILLQQRIVSGRDQKRAYNLAGPPFNPKRAELLACERRASFLELCKRSSSSGNTAELAIAMLTESGGKLKGLVKAHSIPFERYLKYSAKISEKKGSWRHALVRYRRLASSSDPIARMDAVAGQVRCALSLRLLAECVTLTVEEVFKRGTSLGFLPVKDILVAIKEDPPYSDYDRIEFPVFFALATEGARKEFRYLLPDACEAFLYAHRVERPSELLGDIEIFEWPLLRYFLAKACIPSVLQLSPVYTGPDDVLNERIAVLQILVERDSGNSKIYEEEIKEITQRIAIAKAITRIERSKIFVDVEGIKKLPDMDVCKAVFENAQQYFRLFDQFGEVDTVISISGTGRRGHRVRLLSPRREAERMVAHLVQQITELFVASGEYGLDSYLSVNIRHGTLVGELRAPIEAKKLITEVDDKTKKYRPNLNWLGLYQRQEFDNWLIERLTVFSDRIDKIMKELKDELIQVSVDQAKPRGLFDYRRSAADDEELFRVAKEAAAFSEFRDEVIAWLWRKTEINLASVRQTILGDIREALNKELDRLRTDVSKKYSRQYMGAFGDAVNEAALELSRSLENVADWFSVDRELDIEDYDLDMPVSTAISTAQNIHPNVRIRLDWDKRKLMLVGKTLPHVTTVLFNLFDNAVKYGNVVNGAVDIRLETSGSPDDLLVSVANKVPEEELEMLTQQVPRLNARLLKEQGFAAAKTEGQSGLLKIKKILRVDLRAQPSVSVNLDESEFSVDIRVNLAGWCV